jgi:hypothetical protein
MRLIEAEGAQAVSMTRLAADLGCGLVPLYGQVPSQADLLDGIAAALVSGAAVAKVAGGDWRDDLRSQARGLRSAARQYPRCAVAISGRAPATAAMLRPAEQALATLRTAGFGGQDAVRITRAVAAYLAGSLARDVGVAPGLRGDDDGDRRRRHLTVADFPHLTSLAAELADADPGADFELGLDLLIRGIDALLADRAGP